MRGPNWFAEKLLVTNPFLETTPQPGAPAPLPAAAPAPAAVPQAAAPVATPQRGAAILGGAPAPQQPQPAAVDPNVEAARRAREAKILEWVAEMRAAGHPRQALIGQLAQQGVSEMQAHTAINEADMFAGMMGRPHPVDIDPQVKAEIEKQGPMLVTAPLSNAADPIAGDEQSIKMAISEAEQMAAQGADHKTVLAFLTNVGAPAAQAHELAARMTNGPEEEAPKKRFSLRRGKKD